MLNLNCKNVQHVKIYMPCNFEVKSDYPSRSYCPFSSFFSSPDPLKQLGQMEPNLAVSIYVRSSIKNNNNNNNNKE